MGHESSSLLLSRCWYWLAVVGAKWGLGRRVVATSRCIALGAATWLVIWACGDPAVRTDVNVFLTATEFVVGENRFPFVLMTNEGDRIDQAKIEVRFSVIDGESDRFKQVLTAELHEISSGTPHAHADGSLHMHVDARSYYLVNAVSLDTPGIWMADLTATMAEDDPFRAEVAFTVRPDPGALGLGAIAEPITHPILADVSDIRILTTAQNPVVAMYGTTVADAIGDGMPLVVQFSTPQFCVSRMCGPVYGEVAALHATYGDRVRFIHIEPFDLDIARTEGRMVRTLPSQVWGLETEPWVFVIDATGMVAARFEGIVGAREIETAIRGVLD